MSRPPTSGAAGRRHDGEGSTGGGIPLVTIRRLYSYIRLLEEFLEEGQVSISSDQLAAAVGVKASQLRKDLAYIGEFGTRGKGYDIANLHEQLTGMLGLAREWTMALAGVGHIGTALTRYTAQADRGFTLKALFDTNPALIGTRLAGVPIHSADQIATVCKRERIQLGILTVPGAVAQDVADRFIAGGVRALLNIAPVALAVPEGVSVRNVDIIAEMRLLSYMLIGQVSGLSAAGGGRS